MIVVQKDVKFTKLIFYREDLHPRIRMYCECTDDTYDPEIDENGFYIYEIPEIDARQKLKNKSDRWHLYQGKLSNGEKVKPLSVQLETPTGALQWTKFYPWSYEMKSYNVGKYENGEDKVEFRPKWTEHKPEDKKKV